MKYKLYAFPSPSHHYSKEIRGIRFDHQYHLLPEGAEYINKEYNTDKDGIPALFHKEDGVETNYPTLQANEDLSDTLPLPISTSKAKPHYAKIRKKKKVERLLEKEIKKALRQQKKNALTTLKTKFPELEEEITEATSAIDAEDLEDNKEGED
jgi:hypothetical protein